MLCCPNLWSHRTTTKSYPHDGRKLQTTDDLVRLVRCIGWAIRLPTLLQSATLQFVTKIIALLNAFSVLLLAARRNAKKVSFNYPENVGTVFGLQPMNINLCDVIDDPACRRCWLLAKALESAPLDEALALAKEAEAFLAARADASQERGIACHLPGLQLSTSIH
jgi:hypothetical protein